MKRLSSSEFRLTYARESEPIEVTAYDKVIGTWYPADSDKVVSREDDPTTAAAGEVRFTIRPTHGPRPEMVGVTKRVLDPLDMRRNEQTRSEEFQPRQYGPRGR